MDQVAEITKGVQQIREYGFRELERSDRTLVLDRQDLPWMPKTDESDKPLIPLAVPLAYATLYDGTQFYLGSAIKGKALTRLAEELGRSSEGKESRSEQANDLFYVGVQKFFQGSRDVRPIDFAKTEDPTIPEKKRRKIWYYSNGRGVIRTYFIQFENKDNKPVILRVATCFGKNSEGDTLAVLTTQDRKATKKRCHQ